MQSYEKKKARVNGRKLGSKEKVKIERSESKISSADREE
jgi:hypothetical protein